MRAGWGSWNERSRSTWDRAAGGVLGRDEEELDGTSPGPRRLQQQRQLSRDGRALLSVVVQQRPGHGGAVGSPTGRLQGLVQGVLVEHVDELVAQHERAVGE